MLDSVTKQSDLDINNEATPYCCSTPMRQVTSEIRSFYCTHCTRVQVVSTGDEKRDAELLKKVSKDFKRFFGDA